VDAGEIGKLAAFVLPLGVDSFAVAAAVGATDPAPRLRRRIIGLFVVFEGGMPLLGLALGAPLARAVGSVADYIAALLLIGVGAWMLLEDDEDGEQERSRRLGQVHGWALIALGVSISLDELAIGFTLGLSRLPVAAVVIAIALQAALAAALGLRLGARLSEPFRETAEKAAGLALAGLGLYLLVTAIMR
jgi:putative Mn2+ efflux pump MntP